jgi:hypothetical protein
MIYDPVRPPYKASWPLRPGDVIAKRIASSGEVRRWVVEPPRPRSAKTHLRNLVTGSTRDTYWKTRGQLPKGYYVE